MNTDTDEIIYMKPRAIGKAELADLLGYKTSSYFFGLVHQNCKVMQELQKTAYNKSQKMLTAKQMTIICDMYGWPVINK